MIRSAGRRRAVRLGALAAALGVVASMPSTASAVGAGPVYDMSWPQCQPYGQPLPPSTARAIVIGLTEGRPFTVNRCLSTQVSWARSNAQPVQAYTMAGYPTAAQLSVYGSGGPWTGAGLESRLRNVGYAEATYARRAFGSVGMSPRMVWLDVERLGKQPWQSGSPTAQARNRYVVEGLMRGFSDAGIRYGIYAGRYDWTTIIGSWWLPGTPAWGTVGMGSTAEATARCAQPSLSGGPLLMVQWTDGHYDVDVPCARFTLAPALPPPPGIGHDFTRDWHADLLGRTSSGTLYLYPGNGRSSFTARRLVGTGWDHYTDLTAPGDVSGDGIPDLLARTKSGALYLYLGNGRGGFTARRLVGTGWDHYTDLTAPGDVSGDGIPDLLARTKSGALYLYLGNGRGGFTARRLVGTGWDHYTDLTAPGDLTGDGIPDLLARTSSGALYLYPGNGRGGFTARRLVSTGWGNVTLTAPGDLTGDGIPDLLARTSSGTLYLYPGNGRGSFTPRHRIGTGWNHYADLI